MLDHVPHIRKQAGQRVGVAHQAGAQRQHGQPWKRGHGVFNHDLSGRFPVAVV